MKTEHTLHAIVHKISINVITPPENMCVPLVYVHVQLHVQLHLHVGVQCSCTHRAHFGMNNNLVI